MIQHYREGKPTSSWTVAKPDDGRTALEAAERIMIAGMDREASPVRRCRSRPEYARQGGNMMQVLPKGGAAHRAGAILAWSSSEAEPVVSDLESTLNRNLAHTRKGAAMSEVLPDPVLHGWRGDVRSGSTRARYGDMSHDKGRGVAQVRHRAGHFRAHVRG